MSKFKVVCPVCLTAHTMKSNRKVTRHGFKVYNRRHGVVGGAWQTGSCAGSGFPNFGESTEGTEWALGQVRKQIACTEKTLKSLATNPPLMWSYPTRYPHPDEPAPRTLLEGSKKVYGCYYVPSYEEEHKNRVRDGETYLKQLRHDEALLMDAIDSWEPREPAPVAEKQPTVHKSYTDRRGRTRMECGSRGLSVHHTEENSEVTCSRCLKSMK